MCEFLIILHAVSLSVGLTFTPGIGYTYVTIILSVVHGRHYGVHLTPSGNQHK
jgi:hypothetical protein